MPTRVEYYKFIKAVQAKDCVSSSALHAAEMKALALKMGYLQAGGIASKVVKKSKTAVAAKAPPKPVKSLEQRRKDLFDEYKKIVIEVSDSEAVAIRKNKQKKEILEKRKKLV